MASLSANEGERLFFTERKALLLELQQMLQLASENGRSCGLLVVSVRQYNAMYVSYGYDQARCVLREFMDRVEAVLPGRDNMYFIGAGEFAITLTDIRVVHQISLAINKVIKANEANYIVGSSDISVRLNIGASYSANVGDDSEVMLQQAYSALLDAQDSNLPYALFREKEQGVEIPGLELQTYLEAALQKNELKTVYQPKTCFKTGRLVGVETLLRWNSPELGFVSPELFIDASEKSGLIKEVTQHTIRSAAKHYSQWGEYAPNIAVNLSAGLITQPNLIALILRTMRFWSVPLEALTLEITETDVMKSPEASLRTLEELNRHGIRLSIDDFGTGYSSLSYLKNLPVHELKIDKSFIQQITSDVSDRKIVKAIVDLAHTFDLKVVAEGVEDEETYRMLREMGCETCQGYLVARPMSPDDFYSWRTKGEWFGRAEEPYNPNGSLSME